MPLASQISTQELVEGSPYLNMLHQDVSTEPTPIHIIIFGVPRWAQKQTLDKNGYWQVYLARQCGAVADLQPTP